MPLMKQHFQLCWFGFTQRAYHVWKRWTSLSSWLSPFLCLSTNQDPASCHPMSLFSTLNILPPFVANVKSIYLSIRRKHDVWHGPVLEVWASWCVRVLESIFLPPFGFTSPPLNHLVHNRNIKMSKWPNYFCGINNNTLSVMAKLLQHFRASWLGGISLHWVCRLWFHFADLLTFLKQAGDSQQAKK